MLQAVAPALTLVWVKVASLVVLVWKLMRVWSSLKLASQNDYAEADLVASKAATRYLMFFGLFLTVSMQ